MADAIFGWHIIDERTWSFEEGGVRFFLLAGDERALLLDAGMTVHDARERAEGITNLPLTLCLTHADRDHVGSIDEFDEVYVSPAELVHPELRNRPHIRFRGLWDGDTIDLGNRTVKVISLPGHTPGSLAYLDVESRALFSGDPIQEDNYIFMFGPMRSMPAYLMSLARLLERADEIDTIWPCHGTSPLPFGAVPRLIEGAQRVMAGEVGYAITDMHGTSVRAYDTGYATFLMDD